MRINHVIKENIFESFDIDRRDPYFEHWQREIHPLLMEVALAPEQIKQLFKSIETTASEQGSNRTMAGKAVDAAGEVSEKLKDMWYNKLGGALANSQPVKDFDAKWEDVKSKFAGKHPDIAKKLAKYGEFAKNNPTSHKFLLAIAGSLAAALGLAAVGGAAAGITATGLGVGGATALVSIADRLLKGEKASTAIGRGATAGIVAGLTAAGVKAATTALSQLGEIQKIKNSYYVEFNGQGAYVNAEDYKAWTQGMKSASEMTKGIDFMSNSDAYFSASKAGMAKSAEVASQILAKAADPEYQKAAMAAAEIVIKPGAVETAVAALRDAAAAVNPVVSAVAGQAAGSAGEKKESRYVQTRPLSEGQVYVLLKRVSEQQAIMEAGIMDKAKQLGGKALGAVAKGASAVGKQITTNATYPKLFAAWKLEGSPTDSEELKKFLTNYGGITPEVINKVYTDMKLSTDNALVPAETWKYTNPTTGTEYEAGNTKDGQLIINFDGEWETVEDEDDRKAILAAKGAGAAPNIEAVKKMVMALPTDRKIRLLKYIQKQPAPAAA
jgi:hypothetical protein